MRIIFTTFCLLISISFSSLGQENKRVKEIGLAFYNFDEFGLVYKIGHQNSMWRFNVIALTNSKSDLEQEGRLDKEYKSFGVNFSLGKEYYTDLAAKIQFKIGWDLYYGFHKNETKEVASNMLVDLDKLESNQSNYGLGLVLGVNYPINDHIVVGAEVSPGFGWHKNEQKTNGTTTNKSNGHAWGFSNNNASLTLSYRF